MMGTGLYGGILVVDPVVHQNSLLWIKVIFLITGIQSVDFRSVVHELPMLHAFDDQEIGDGGEDIPKVGHLCLDIKGRRHGELAVAAFIEFLEDFDNLRIKGTISEKGLIRTKVAVHLGSQFRMGFQFQGTILGKDWQNLRKLLTL